MPTGWGGGVRLRRHLPGEEPTYANVIFLGHHNFSNGQPCRRHISFLFRMGGGHRSAVGIAIAAVGARGGFESMKLAKETDSFPLPGSLAGSDP